MIKKNPINSIDKIEAIGRNNKVINILPNVDLDDIDIQDAVKLAYYLGKTRAITDLMDDCESRIEANRSQMINAIIQTAKTMPELKGKAFAEAALTEMLK